MKLAVQTKATVINIRVHEACSEMFYSGQGRCGLNNYLLIFYILFEIEPAKFIRKYCRQVQTQNNKCRNGRDWSKFLWGKQSGTHLKFKPGKNLSV